MHPDRIAELLEPFLGPATPPNHCHSEPGRRPGEEPAVLSPAQLHDISRYIDILLRWNTRINLTAIRNQEDIVTRHFGESLFAARHLFPKPATASPCTHVGTAAPGCPAERSSAGASAPEASAKDQRPMATDKVSLADVGSGAGFPGIPIKLWAPHISLTLIESNHKKAAFLREVARTLTLTNVNVFPGRTEQLFQEQPPQKQARPVPGSPMQSHRGGFNLVTLRAVEHFAEILPVAAGLVSSGGRLALLIGVSQVDQARSALPNLGWDTTLAIPQSHSRTLTIGHRS